MSGEPVVVAEWQRNTRERVRVSLEVFNGSHVASVRIWFDAGGGTLKPGRDGLTLGLKHLPALADAFAKALAEAKARGWITD